MEKLVNILNEIRPDVDFRKEKELIDRNILNSFDIISIVAAVNTEYDIKINVNDIVPENFNSIESLMLLIDKLK